MHGAKLMETLMEYAYVLKKGIDRKPLFYILVNENGDIVSDGCEMCRSEAFCHHRYQMVVEISDELNELAKKDGWVDARKEYLRQKAEEEKERLREEKYQKKRTESISKVSGLLDNFGNPEMLTAVNPVHLEPTLSIYHSKQDQQIMLSMKVGIDKMYIVSDIVEFLERVKNREEHSYGKSLSFVHDLGHFDEPARKLIRLLLNLKIIFPDRHMNFIPDAKEIKVKNETAGKILSFYKGQRIFGINLEGDGKEGYYALTLDAVRVHFRLSPNYVLTTDGLDSYEILDGGDRYFLIHDGQIESFFFKQIQASVALTYPAIFAIYYDCFIWAAFYAFPAVPALFSIYDHQPVLCSFYNSSKAACRGTSRSITMIAGHTDIKHIIITIVLFINMAPSCAGGKAVFILARYYTSITARTAVKIQIEANLVIH
jgi:hypothetical protein